MKYYIVTFLLFVNYAVFAQNGNITDREKLNWRTDNEIVSIVLKNGQLKEKYSYLNDVKIEKITYESDGLKVKGYLVQPIKRGEFPCVIYNRGGNREFGKLTPKKAVFILARIASWGYVVAASQYRGNDGSEGREEFGGKDVDDVLNLIPLFNNIESADTAKMGIYGWSRGGMMTYLALTRTGKFKAAVVGGGASDLRMVMETRKDTFETVYYDNIPGYAEDKAGALNSRSAINQVENICKTTPVLMLHGTADWRIVPEMALNLSAAFIKHKIPHRLVMFEGGDHGLTGFRNEVNTMVKQWFDSYLKNNKKLPNLEQHGS